MYYSLFQIVMNEREVIFKTALASRSLLILIQYISNTIIPDHEADAYHYPKSNANGVLDNLTTNLLGGFVRWDAQHFMHISRYGYTYEHTLAFFPFYPFIVRFIALGLNNFIPFLNLDSLTLIMFIAINTFCFVQTALCLYELSLSIANKELAYKASILFCYNPASVFFTAPYTESLFCYLTFKSTLNCVLLYKKFNDAQNEFQIRDVAYIVPICLSTLTRSNGVLNVGFLIYTLICLYLEKLSLKKQIFNCLLCTIKFITLTLFLITVSILPFVLFEFYSYKMFCNDFETNIPATVLAHKDIEKFVLPGTFSKHNQSWCFKKIPLAYSYVQSHYWKVGFLQYYEFKQIPNFILASPIVFILLEGALKYFNQFPKDFRNIFNLNLIKRKQPPASKTQHNPVMIVFVVHSTVLTIFCVLNIHVQVTTRMLCSASPVLYWFSAHYVSDLSKNNLFEKLFYKHCYPREYFILGYFLSYYVIGTVLFCNFLPWT
jgi:phosphatidylinositol glycan class V